MQSKEERFKDLEKLIAETQTLININTSTLKSLMFDLEKAKLEKWSPPSGQFIVDHTGAVVDITKQNPGIVNSEFGNVRSTQNTAAKLSTNMKLFNRLSAYVGDINPVVEYGNFQDCSTISLVFYDWSGKLSDKLREDINSGVVDLT